MKHRIGRYHSRGLTAPLSPPIIGIDDICSIRVSGITFRNNIAKHNYRESFRHCHKHSTASNEQTFADYQVLHRYI